MWLCVARSAFSSPTPLLATGPQVYAGCLEAKLRQLVCETRVPVTVNSDDPVGRAGVAVEGAC